MRLSPARVSGAQISFPRASKNTCLAKAEMEFARLAKTALRGANLHAADLSGVLLEGAVPVASRSARYRRLDAGANPIGHIAIAEQGYPKV
jgi:uncharacterized protein YjbI with pentapeptide repeats